MAFGRRKERVEPEMEGDTSSLEGGSSQEPLASPGTEPAIRTEGPWDADALPDGDAVERVDLGSLLLAPGPGIEVQVQADPATGKITQLTLRTADSALQLQPYAAPRSGGMWADIRAQISASVSAQGGLAEEVSGSLGLEVHAMVNQGEGSSGLAPARFVGIDGPRWFVRGVFMGAAARDESAAAPLEAVLRGSAVRRGSEAAPVGAPLPMQIPSAVQAPGAPAETPATVNPFVRGPEITEIR